MGFKCDLVSELDCLRLSIDMPVYEHVGPHGDDYFAIWLYNDFDATVYFMTIALSIETELDMEYLYPIVEQYCSDYANEKRIVSL